MLQCRTCKVEKPPEAFAVERSRKSGRQSDCRECKSAIAAHWRLQNAEKVLAERAARVLEGRAREATQKHRQLRHGIPRPLVDRSKIPPRTPLERAAIKAAWKKANRESVKASSARNRAKRLKAGGAHTAAEIKALFVCQRGCCAICRVSLPSNYHKDHVIPFARGGTNDILNIQLLCPSCNRLKSSKDPISFMQEKGFLL